MKVKSIKIEKTNSDGITSIKEVEGDKAKKHLDNLNRIDISYIINNIEKIKQKPSKKNIKETPHQYLFRKLRNCIHRRNKLKSSFTNLNDDLLVYCENEIIEYYKKYLIELDRLKQGKLKSGDRFGTESNNSVLSINTKKNKS